jgi:hypothetical protein
MKIKTERERNTKGWRIGNKEKRQEYFQGEI